MNPSPDKLFRERLEPLRTPPPSGAWERIAVNVIKQKRRNTVIRWSAASLLLMLVLLVGYWSTIKTSSLPAPIQQESQTPAVHMAEASSPGPAEIKSEPTVKSISTPGPERKTRQYSSVEIAAPSREVKVEMASTVENISGPVATASTVELTPIIPSHTDSAPTYTSAAIAKSKIVYSADDVLRFKRKPKPAPVDTSRSTFQRVIDVAYEIKNENTWLGDLRQMKDELFSRPANGPARDK